MSRFRKKQHKNIPELNMASMSDIIFMFLFFFMIISTMRQSTLFVRTMIPPAENLQRLEKKGLVSTIYIGIPWGEYTNKLGSVPRIQLNDQFADVKDIAEFVEIEKQSRSQADREKIIWTLKVDETVSMGIVNDVKQELRKAGAYKINYSAKQLTIDY